MGTLLEKAKEVIRTIGGGGSAPIREAKDFQIVMNKEEDILWIGRPNPSRDSVLCTYTEKVIVEVNPDRRITSVAIIDASRHELFRKLFNGMDASTTSERRTRFYFDF